MPRLRLDASPTTLTVDRGENPVMGGLTQGLHSLWEGQNRASEINREGARDRDQQQMQLWERQHGDKADQMRELEFLHQEGDSDKAHERQGILDQEARDQRGIENERKTAEDTHLWDYQGKEATARDRAAAAAEKRAASYDKMVGERWGAGGTGGMNEREAWRQAEIMAQHESIDEFGKPKAVDPQRVQDLHDHLMERKATEASPAAPGGAAAPQDGLWDHSGAPAPQGAAQPSAAPAAAPTTPIGQRLPQHQQPSSSLWSGGNKPAISQDEVAAATEHHMKDQAQAGIAEMHRDPNAERQAAFLHLAGDSAPADDNLLADMTSDDPVKVQNALRVQYQGRPDHLKVAVAALRKIHGGAQAPEAPQAPQQAQPAQDPLWDDSVATGR